MRTRRQVLAGLGATALLPAAGRTARASGPPMVVVIRLKGGLDGLAAVIPHADPAYRARRGRLALDKPGQPGGALDLDGFWGLHPALPTLAALWRAGSLQIAPAAATAYRGRAHGEAEAALQALLPVASPARQAARPGDGSADLAADLASSRPALGARLAGLDGAVTDAAIQNRLRLLATRREADFIAAAAEAGRDAALGKGRIAVLDCHGFDTHADQGAGTGRLARALATLDAGVAALRAAAGPAWDRTTMAVVTEFGRTVAPNADGGTDHGVAGAAFLAGGRIGSSRVLGGRVRLDGDVVEPQVALADVVSGLV